MRCCVPCCIYSSDNVSIPEGKEITFQGFPSEVSLRAAWLKTLGMQDTHLPDNSVVCSQHFINDDIYDTDSCLKQIRIDAIYSAVQVCMICLDTDSKLFLVSKLRLEETYEKLTGHTITIEHIQMINCADNKPKFNLVATVLEPDHCDLYVEYNEEQQTELDEIDSKDGIVKSEEDTDFEMIDEDIKEINEYDNYIDNYECVSSEVLSNINNKLANVLNHATYRSFDNNGTATCSAVAEQVTEIQKSVGYNNTNSRLRNCYVKLYDITKNPKQAVQDSLTERNVRKVAETLLKDCNIVKFNSTLKKRNRSRTEEKLSNGDIKNKPYSCGIYKRELENKSNLVQHKKTHAVEKRFSCDICHFKCAYKCILVNHMRTHTGETPFSCKICHHKFTQKSILANHMVLHTGEKRFKCTLCNYKCTRNAQLALHMTTHTGEKLFSCEMCEYKCRRRSQLVYHMASHTGIMPYSCKICDYKCVRKMSLPRHMKVHTGEKPFHCAICDYKCALKCYLVSHMRTHTGEKPYSCDICVFRCSTRSHLVRHLTTHSSEKPISCDMCNYKCAHKSNLSKHMAIHNGKKLISCEICGYKCARELNLLEHLGTHMGEKSFY